MDTLEAPARESLLTDFQDTGLTATRGLNARSVPLEPISAQDYILELSVAFENFQTSIEGSDFKPDQLPKHYITSPCDVIFPPTIGRVIQHNSANMEQALSILLDPTLDFHTNKNEISKDNGTSLNEDDRIKLIEVFMHLGEAMQTYRAQQSVNTSPVNEHLILLNERVLNLTERFCVDKDEISMLPSKLRSPTPHIQEAGGYNLSLN